MIERVRYYNPGLRIEETFNYTRDTGDSRLNNISRWHMEAPKDGFFFVPIVIEIDNVRTIVMFENDVMRRFGERGVVPCPFEPSPGDSDAFKEELAKKEAAVVATAKEAWKKFCNEVATNHLQQCLNCRANNMPPVPAKGFTLAALEIAGVPDPADAYMQLLKENSEEGRRAREDRDRMQREIAGLENQVRQMQGQARMEISEYQRAANRLYDANASGNKKAIADAREELDQALRRAKAVARDTSSTIPGQKEPEEVLAAAEGEGPTGGPGRRGRT